jgi:hypothetical protein
LAFAISSFSSDIDFLLSVENSYKLQVARCKLNYKIQRKIQVWKMGTGYFFGFKKVPVPLFPHFPLTFTLCSNFLYYTGQALSLSGERG